MMGRSDPLEVSSSEAFFVTTGPRRCQSQGNPGRLPAMKNVSPSFDALMAVLSIHRWTGPNAGLIPRALRFGPTDLSLATVPLCPNGPGSGSEVSLVPSTEAPCLVSEIPRDVARYDRSLRRRSLV